jgi:dehydrogenase/reductase SDR family member 1
LIPKMKPLTGQVAIVTGSSRGVGKGIAVGLGEAGATVYITGRTTSGTDVDGLPGTIYDTAEEVTRAGGQGIAVACDHSDDAQVQRVFEQIAAEQTRLDILVNNVWAGYQRMEHDGTFTFFNKFWEQPFWRWDAMFASGVRAHFVASAFAARTMVKQQRGLIVTVSFWAAQKYMSNVMYGAAKAADDALTRDMAHDLREHNVAAISLYPGLVRTEGVMKNAEYFDMSNSESPQFNGRAVAGLASDPNIMEKSGKVLVSAALALEYGFSDIDGKQPRPATLEAA